MTRKARRSPGQALILLLIVGCMGALAIQACGANAGLPVGDLPYDEEEATGGSQPVAAPPSEAGAGGQAGGASSDE